MLGIKEEKKRKTCEENVRQTKEKHDANIGSISVPRKLVLRGARRF